MTFYTWTVDADLARQLHRGDSESEFSQIDLDKLRFKAFAECKKKAKSSRTHTQKKQNAKCVSNCVLFSHFPFYFDMSRLSSCSRRYFIGHICSRYGEICSLHLPPARSRGQLLSSERLGTRTIFSQNIHCRLLAGEVSALRV